jgi:hypothetical protein
MLVALPTHGDFALAGHAPRFLLPSVGLVRVLCASNCKFWFVSLKVTGTSSGGVFQDRKADSSAGRRGPQCLVTVAIGVNDSGYREILGICEGSKEDKAGWSAFLKHLGERGLRGFQLIISDACMELSESAAEFFPDARLAKMCRVVHWYRNIFSNAPSTKCARSPRCSSQSTPARTLWRHGRRLSK